MNTAIIRLTLSLLIGIGLGFYLELPSKTAFLSLFTGLAFFLFGYFRARRLMFQDLYFGSTTFILFLLLGIFITSNNLPQNQPHHYLNEITSEEIPVLKLRIKETLKPDLYNQKYIAEVIAVNKNTSHGKLLLLQPKDSLKMSLLEGEEILVSGNLNPVPSSLNPHQFDYSKFMARKGVWRQIELRNSVYYKLGITKHDLRTTASNFRKEIIQALQENNFGRDELAVVQALLLGQKQDISTETYNNFAAAGAIHILAVSGLHVGIILLILNRIYAPLKRIKKGRFLKTFFTIISLWGFALLAGLSPSVVRAVTMFSFIAVGIEIKRQTSTLNSVFLSLLILLIIQPQWIFEVGFQLSYSAVISIILFQPLLAGLFNPSSRIIKYIWNLLTVTIAAQVGVLPLSLYYFHQFPGLFFLTNLLILPFLGLILLLGVLVMVLAVMDILPSIFVQAYESIIKILNQTVAFIAKQEQFLFKDISFNASEVLAWYLFIFLAFLLWKNFSFRRFAAVLSSVILLQMVYFHQKLNIDDQLLVLHKSRNSIIGKKEGKELQLFHNLPENASDLKLIQNYKVGENLSEIKEQPLKNIYLQKGHFWILLDSTGIIPTNVPDKASLLITGSPKVNLERILENFKPDIIIADGSNYKTMVEIWRQTAIKLHLPFHYTGENGAYIK